MNIPRYAQVAAIVLISVSLAIVDAKKCRKADRKAGKCAPKKDRRKSRSPKKPEAPSWRKGPPKDNQIIVREGSDVTLNCAITGSPKPDFAWLMNGKTLDVKSTNKYRTRKSKLIIKSVEIQDTASYTCVAKNKIGTLEYSYSIKVLEHVPLNDIEVEDPPENQTAHVGDTVIFMCRSADWPKPRVDWARKTETRNVVENLVNPSSEPDVLVIHNVTKQDSGTYTCFIGNDNGVKELSASLRVIEEGERLPFEPACSLHIRREVLKDHAHGCKTAGPVEMHYCMGSCGRSYYVPQMVTSDMDSSSVPASAHLNQTCQCCVGIVDGLRLVELECPLGKKKTGFYTLLRDCQCQACSVGGQLTTPKPST